AGEDVGNGLDAAMRMPRKPGEIILRMVVAKIVEQQERIELGRFPETECPLQLHAGALDGGRRTNDFFDRSDRHDCSPSYCPNEIYAATACAAGRRSATLTMPPTIPTASAPSATAGVHNDVSPRSPSTE